MITAAVAGPTLAGYDVVCVGAGLGGLGGLAAAALSFLCGPEAAFITAHDIAVDGGVTAK